MGKQYWKPGNMLYPVPAVMVSCKRADEKPNIITTAWCGTTCSSPAMVYVSIRPDRYSYDIIKESGEFVINLISEDLTFATDYCGVKSGRDVDKFVDMKLTPLESKHISAPGIAESPVNIECKVTEIIPLGSHHMFLGEVVGVTIDDEYMDETGRFNLNDSGLVAYSHGEYFGLGDKLGKFGYSVRKSDRNGNKKGNNRINNKKSENKKADEKIKTGKKCNDKNRAKKINDSVKRFGKNDKKKIDIKRNSKKESI